LEFEILNSRLSSTVVEVSPSYFRPTEVDLLIGNPAKAKEKLGWEAETKFSELVSLMVKADLLKVIEKGY
jgi:GDPmannose 4,6-dehydratase